MKKTALTMAISSLLLAGGAQASTVYNQDGTKLDIGGRVQGMYYGSDNDSENGDQSYLRLRIGGETRINSETVANGFIEYNVPTNDSDTELRYAYVGVKNDRFGAFSYGRQDGLIAKAVNDYTDVLPEWGGDGLGKGTEVFGTGRTNGLAQYFYTFDGLVLGAQFTGENEAQNDSTSSWTKGSAEGYALSANYNFDMGISLGLAYNQAGKTADQSANSNFGGDDDAKLTAVGIKYNANNLYAAATYAYGEDHVYVNQSGYNGYAEESNGYEAVVQYTWGQWKPSLAYNRLDVKGETFDDTLTEYVSIGAWYNINENFDVYVDYKANLLSGGDTDGYNEFGQNTDDVVGVAMQYHF
ncbi:porin [Aeromonas encheleia]|uniref:Porin n=1 Tax=Aeromonas encheleia TaxID=73010 RepID=A0AAE9MGY2_9GAMM|nr:porin [Aeromonas encheleia]USV58354.1 porin [Aeromonas encheleia]